MGAQWRAGAGAVWDRVGGDVHIFGSGWLDGMPLNGALALRRSCGSHAC